MSLKALDRFSMFESEGVFGGIVVVGVPTVSSMYGYWKRCDDALE